MIHWKTITDRDAQHAIDHKEFSSSVTGSHENVAVILTQGWCPQWTALKRDLEDIDHLLQTEIDIYLYIYDRSPLFIEFLHFKKHVLGNTHIPYVRYYKNSILLTDSNFVNGQWFVERFSSRVC